MVSVGQEMNRLLRSGLWVGFAASMEIMLVLVFTDQLVWSKVIASGTITVLAYRYVQNTFRNDVLDKCLLIILCFSLSLLNLQILLWWIPLLVIVFLYKNAFLGLNMRRTGSVKSMVISFSWLLLIGACLDFSQLNIHIIIILLSEFFMFLSLTAVNDLFLDVGEESPWKSKLMMRCWMICFALLSALLFLSVGNFQLSLLICAVAPLALTLSLWRRQYPRTLMPFLWVDGCIILRGFLVFISLRSQI